MQLGMTLVTIKKKQVLTTFLIVILLVYCVPEAQNLFHGSQLHSWGVVCVPRRTSETESALLG